MSCTCVNRIILSACVFYMCSCCLYSIIVLDEVDQLTEQLLYSLIDMKIILIGIANTLKMTTACK